MEEKVEEKVEEKDKTRILLVEDHTSFRQALVFMFEREEEFNVVGQVGSVAEAHRLRNVADVAVVDLGLPDGDGIELVEKYSSDEPKVATLVLSASLAPERFAAAVDAGAAGVLHKSASISEIVGAVRRLKNGEVLLSPDQIVEMMRLVNRRRQEEGEVRKAIEKLTRREKEILQALAEGLDSKQIAQKLHITVETERTHIGNVLNKLGLKSRLQALIFAVRHGIVGIR